MANPLLWAILTVTMANFIMSCLNRGRLTSARDNLNLHRADVLTGETQRAEGLKEGRDQSIVERHDRVLEAERVEDRAIRQARDNNV
jgi:hypothetical protein